MSIPIGITPKAYKEISSTLQKEKEIICLDQNSLVLTLLVGRHLLTRGKHVAAKITKGYGEPTCRYCDGSWNKTHKAQFNSTPKLIDGHLFHAPSDGRHRLGVGCEKAHKQNIPIACLSKEVSLA